jgi:hypothetical protein
MAEIRPQRITPKDRGLSKRRIYAKVCYYYPRYSLKEVEALPARDVRLLLKTAQEEQASYLHNMTLIVQAPHSKKQSNVKKLLEHFKKLSGIYG